MLDFKCSTQSAPEYVANWLASKYLDSTRLLIAVSGGWGFLKIYFVHHLGTDGVEELFKREVLSLTKILWAVLLN